MEIYILRDGSQTGPFSEQTIQRLLAENSVAPSDLAWRPGAPHWIPLQEVLQALAETVTKEVAPAPAATATLQPATVEPAIAAEKVAEPLATKASETPDQPAASAARPEPATAKQRAFLGYMGVTVPADIGKEQAALLVSEIMENPKEPSKLARWNEDRFRLHPELFAAELQAKKENRAGHFFELAQTVGGKCFQDLAKAHCQVLVGYLDVKFPHWDARESDATWHYFFPAIAEKFPDLVTKEWRGKLKYPSGPKVAMELKNRSSAHVDRPTPPSPIWGLLQGLGIGVIALAVIVGGIRLMHFLPATAGAKTPSSSPAAPAPANPNSTESAASSSAPAPGTATVQPPAPAEAPASPLETSAAPPATAPSVADATVTPASAPSPSAAAPAAPPAVVPGNAAPMAIPPAPDVVAGQPSANSETPKPAAPASASSLDALFAAPGSPAAAPATPAPTAPATAAAATPTPSAPPATSGKKANVTLTKAIDVPVPFGKTQLPAGTQLKLISQEGAFVKVDYLNMVITVPVNATDLNAETP